MNEGESYGQGEKQQDKGYIGQDDEKEQANPFVCGCQDKQEGGAKQGEKELANAETQNALPEAQ
ncbi:MAG: hypothetical protein N3F07_00455 [Candidatus Micrarchaeota archaeon]|nr:hypothetical protein [Candidatus Micrarchaeota archaeon]